MIVNLAAGRDDTTTRDTALRSLTDVAFSEQYTSAFWDVERTNQSTRGNEARADYQSPVHRLVPNCRDEENLALVREALRS